MRKDTIEVCDKHIRIEGSTYERIFIEKQVQYFIYFLFSGSELVYVGQSVQPRSRITTHKNNEALDFDSFCIVPSTHLDFDSVNEAEASYIVDFMPRYNTRIPKNNLYLTPGRVREELNLYGKISAKNLGYKLACIIEDKVIMPDGNIYFNINEVEDKIGLISMKHYKKLQP